MAPPSPRLYLLMTEPLLIKTDTETTLCYIVVQSAKLSGFPDRSTLSLVCPTKTGSRPLVEQQKLSPTRLLEFLKTHHLHWTCFCVIRVSTNNELWLVDLNYIYHSTTLEQEYLALATRVCGDLQYKHITAQFLLVGHPQDKDFLSPRDAPIFPGYFGESVVEFPGVIQQGGLVLFINHALKVETTFIQEEDIKPFIKGEPLDLDLSGSMGMLPSGTKVSQDFPLYFKDNQIFFLYEGEAHTVEMQVKVGDIAGREDDNVPGMKPKRKARLI
ncbi:hypothetical protein B0H13DRAFT_1914466 [Mycena leptocephala]|nr:hypothetical protein B0H13DRAFT_1914466 [Mycena leptocephala]